MTGRSSEDEIEVTPEMMSAGKDALSRYDGDSDVTVWTVSKAMVLASPILRNLPLRDVP